MSEQTGNPGVVDMTTEKVDALREAVVAVMKLHVWEPAFPAGGLVCEHDGMPWPCPTAHAIGNIHFPPVEAGS